MEDRISKLANRIKEMKLSSLVLFILVAHLPLRGLLFQSIEAFHPIIKFILGENYAEDLRWLLESPERLDKLCIELER